MTLIQESFLYRLWTALLACYYGSALHRFLAASGRWCNRQIDTSRILAVLCREGAAARSWPESTTCRILTWLVDLPGNLLHRLYRALSLTFEDSLIARLLFDLGESTAIAQSWLMMLLWVIPFSRWNNSYSLLAFAFLALLFHAGAMHRSALRLDVEHIGFYPLVFLLAVALSVFQSYAPAMSLRFLFYHASAALCVLVTVSAVRSEDDLKRLAAGAAVCVGVTGSYGIYQRIQGVEVNPSIVDLKVNVGIPGRVLSIFDNVNTFAEVLLLLLPLVVALILCSRHWYMRLLACGIFVVGVAAMGMTYSRASWVGLACAAVVFVFLWNPRLIPLFAVLCVLAIPLMPTTIWNRILTIANPADKSTANRIPLYKGAWAAITSRPIRGVGLGTAVTQRYISDWNLFHAKFPYVHAHNFYLEVWLETGLLGLLGFLSAMLWNIKRVAHAVRHSRGNAPARVIGCAAASALCGIMVCGLADFPWHYPRVLCIFWFVFAMALAAVKVLAKDLTLSENPVE